METITHTFKEGDAVKIEGLGMEQRKTIFDKMLKDGCLEYENITDWDADFPFLYWSDLGTYFYGKDAPSGLGTPWNYLTWEDITKPVETTPEGKEAATHFRGDLYSLYKVTDRVESWDDLHGTWGEVAGYFDVESWLEELTPIEEYNSEPLSDGIQEELPEALYSLGGLIKMAQDTSEDSLGALNITLQGDGQLLLHGEGFPCTVLTDLNPTEINKVLEVMKMLDGKFVEDVQ